MSLNTHTSINTIISGIDNAGYPSSSRNRRNSSTKKRRLSDIYDIFSNLPPEEQKLYNNNERKKILKKKQNAFKEERKLKRAQIAQIAQSKKSNSSSRNVLKPIQPTNQVPIQLHTQPSKPQYKIVDLFEQFCNKYDMKEYEKDIFKKYIDSNLNLLYELSKLVLEPHNKSTKITFD